MSFDEIAREERLEVARCYQQLQASWAHAAKCRRLAIECDQQGLVELAQGFAAIAAKNDEAAAGWEENARLWGTIADSSTFLAAHHKSKLDSEIAFLALQMKRGKQPRQNAAAN